MLKRDEIQLGHFAVLLTQQRSATITSQDETSFLAYYQMRGGKTQGEPPKISLIGVYPSRDLFTPAGQQFWFKNNLNADPVKFVKHELEVKAQAM